MNDVKRIKASELTPDSHNANRGTERGRYALEASLRQYGAGRSILVDKHGRIIAGNKTLETATDVGLDDVIVVQTDGKQIVAVQRMDLDLAQDDTARMLAYADNRVGQLDLDFDPEVIAADIAAGLDLSAFWQDFELDEIAAELEPEPTPGEDTEPQIDRAEELRQKWGVETGQMWQLGEHRLICGDCTDAAVVERVMGGEKACLIFTDPPYGVAIGEKNRLLNSFQPSGRNLTDIVDDSLSTEDLEANLLQAFINMKKVAMADDCTVFVTAPQGGELGMMMMMMKSGLPVRHVLIWKKNQPTFSLGRLDYDYQHEPILMTWGKRHKRPMAGPHRTSVWEIDRPRSSAAHPTMKPVELVENALLNNSDNGDVSFDAYSGSGTTIIACENLHRKCRAVEISPGYVAVALERWAEHTGRTPELIT